MNTDNHPSQNHSDATSGRLLARLSMRYQLLLNWLAGGPLDLQKVEAKKLKYPSLIKRYVITIALVATYGVVLLYPLILTRALNATPEVDRMQTIQVRILKTHDIDPHLDVKLIDGREKSMEWPQTITFLRGMKFPYWTKPQRLALEGCQATLQVAPIRGTLEERYRVWSLSCSATGFNVQVTQTAQWLSTSMRTTIYIDIFIHSIVLMLLIVVFLREKRGVI